MPKITFNDPKTGTLITFEADTAHEMKKLIEQIENSNLKEILKQFRTYSKETTSKMQDDFTSQISHLTAVDKIKLILDELVIGWHTSTEIKEEYERVFNEEIKQQTISTNLLRLSKQEILERRRLGKMYEYRVNKEKLRESFSDETLLLSES
ncbi:MAG: winged helix-turn-helix domain-containing protein [Promethearchaeota archaeon]